MIARARLLLFAVVAIGLALVPARAAADPSDKQREAAEKLFFEGREAQARGEDELACAKFRSSVTLFPVPNALANVARCAEREGDAVEALRTWEQVIAAVPAGDPRLGPARERAAALENRVGRIALMVPADLPADARLLLDGALVPRAAWSASLIVAPGDHAIVVEVPGRAPRRTVVTVAAGDRQQIAVEAAPAPVAPAPPPPPPVAARPARDLRPAAFAVGGIGIAGFVVAGITGGVLLARDARIQKLCPDHVCTPEGTREIAGSKPLLAVNAVTWGVGLAGVGAGAVLLLVGRGRAAPATGVTPLVIQGGAGASFGGAF